MDSDYQVKKFYTSNDPELLNDEANVVELHRRVSVFHNALSTFDELYEVLSGAYKGSPFASEQSKKEYKTNGAKGFLAEILFNDSDKQFTTTQEVIEAEEHIKDVLNGDTENDRIYYLKNEIEEILLNMLSFGYPEGFLEAVKWKVEHLESIFRLLDIVHSDNRIINEQYHLKYNKQGDKTLLTAIYSDLFKLKNNHLEGAYNLYVNQYTEGYFNFNSMGGDYDHEGSRKVSNEQFQKSLDELIETIGRIIEIDIDQNAILKEVSLINPDHVIESSFTKLNILFVDHFSKFKLYERIEVKKRTFEREDEERETIEPSITYIPIENIERLIRSFHQKLYGIGDTYYNSETLVNILDKFDELRAKESFDRVVGREDYEEIRQDKILFGAKSAYLSGLIRFKKKFDELNLLGHLEWFIPPTECVSIEYYKKWKETGVLDEAYFKKLHKGLKKGKPYIARSSAVNSEDNDISTGAGIYHSEVFKNNGYQAFCNAILKVYESCDSDGAKKYRNTLGIDEEYMGLVIEPFIEGENKGQINTILPNRPELLELTSARNTRLRPVFIKEGLSKALFTNNIFLYWLEYEKELLHYKLDYHKIHRHSEDENIRNYKEAAALALAMERYFGVPIQIEYILRDDTLHIVQVRPLPQPFSTLGSIEFPNEGNLLREGRALGSCDILLDVLETGEDNGDKTGLVSFKHNYMASFNTDAIAYTLPKEGGVVIRYVGGDWGHIETICVEKGVICLFNGEFRNENDGDDKCGYQAGFVRGMALYNKFCGFKKVRVVANGLEGRVYGIGEPESEVNN